MKKIIATIFLLISFIYLMDYNASRYGNGIFILYHKLKFGTSITKINSTYITYDKNWKYEGYIMPENYYLCENDSIHIKNINSYYINRTNLVVQIQNQKNDFHFLVFGNKNEIYNKKPKIFDSLDKIPGIQGYSKVDLFKKPWYIYYWKLLFLVLIIISLIISISGISKYIKNR